jgi:hypothetical protein
MPLKSLYSIVLCTLAGTLGGYIFAKTSINESCVKELLVVNASEGEAQGKSRIENSLPTVSVPLNKMNGIRQAAESKTIETNGSCEESCEDYILNILENSELPDSLNTLIGFIDLHSALIVFSPSQKSVINKHIQAELENMHQFEGSLTEALLPFLEPSEQQKIARSLMQNEQTSLKLKALEVLKLNGRDDSIVVDDIAKWLSDSQDITVTNAILEDVIGMGNFQESLGSIEQSIIQVINEISDNRAVRLNGLQALTTINPEHSVLTEEIYRLSSSDIFEDNVDALTVKEYLLTNAGIAEDERYLLKKQLTHLMNDEEQHIQIRLTAMTIVNNHF